MTESGPPTERDELFRSSAPSEFRFDEAVARVSFPDAFEEDWA